MNDLFERLYQWPTIATLAIIITGYCLYLNHKFSYWRKRNFSGPTPIPLLGNLHSYFIKTQPETELEWYKKYGKLFGIFVGSTPVISVAEPQLIKQILVQDFHQFRNRRDSPSDDPVLSKIMFFSHDDDWKRIRAIASPTFTSGKLKKMYGLISESCDEFVESLDEYAKGSKEIELKKLHGAYTMDVIAKCAFATHTNSHKNPDNEFTRNASSLFTIKNWRLLLLFSLPDFLSRHPTFRKTLLGSGDRDFFINVGRELIKKRKHNNEKHNDFLQLLMDVERNDSVLTERDVYEGHHVNEGNEEIAANYKALNNVTEKKLTENEILAQCWLFFIAGYETTATTLSFCSYELATHPEVQEKLFDEIKTAIDKTGKIDYEVLFKLPYLDSVITETLRKYPPVIRLERQAMSDIKLGENGFVMPKGMIAEIPVYAIHYDPENYSNPFEFNPERFMPENRSALKPYTYLPFGAGPRNCIGMRFALLEAKLALVHITLKFQFFRTSNTDVPLQFNNGRRLLQAKRLIVGIKRR